MQQLKVGGVCLHAWQDGELEEIIKRSRSEVAIRYATFPMLVLLKRMLLYPHLVGREVQEVYLSRIYIYAYSYIYIHIYILISIFISIFHIYDLLYIHDDDGQTRVF